METTTTDVEKLTSRYGLQLLPVNPSANPNDSIVKLAEDQKHENKQKSKSRRFTPSGMRWVLQDSQKLEALLDRLVYLNNSLEHLCPQKEVQLLSLGLSSYILPSINYTKGLSEIEKSSQGVLACCALMKRLELSSHSKQTVDPVRYEIFKDSLTQINHGRRETAVILDSQNHETNILIEWKAMSKNLEYTQRQEADSRVNKLCTLLSGNKPAPFSLLSCIGLVSDAPALPGSGDDRIGVVFAFPKSHTGRPTSLSSIITNSPRTAPLGERFALARALASAVLLFHSARWIHKGLCGDNILFFPSNDSQKSALASPFILGFEYARPEDANSWKAPLGNAKYDAGKFDMYRHPEWTDGFTRLSDIYSLGILLFEIALWKPIEKYRESSETLVREKLLHNAPLLLPGIVGSRYSEVVRLCLKGDFGIPSHSEDLDRVFWLSVVRELSTCTA